jgi:hypothetical protein
MKLTAAYADLVNIPLPDAFLASIERLNDGSEPRRNGPLSSEPDHSAESPPRHAASKRRG